MTGGKQNQESKIGSCGKNAVSDFFVTGRLVFIGLLDYITLQKRIYIAKTGSVFGILLCIYHDSMKKLMHIRHAFVHICLPKCTTLPYFSKK